MHGACHAGLPQFHLGSSPHPQVGSLTRCTKHSAMPPAPLLPSRSSSSSLWGRVGGEGVLTPAAPSAPQQCYELDAAQGAILERVHGPLPNLLSLGLGPQGRAVSCPSK